MTTERSFLSYTFKLNSTTASSTRQILCPRSFVQLYGFCVYDIIMLNFGNESTVGLTSIYNMIILDMGDEVADAAGLTSGPSGHGKRKGRPWWPSS